MNFVGKFDDKLPADDLTGHGLTDHGPAGHNVAHAHVDGTATHAPADAIIVSDAQLLFGGDFKRSGVDLILTKDDHELVLHDYFKGEKRVALSSPDGAHLTGDLVNALAGHVEYAQAGGAVAAAAVVGHVTKLVGSATAIRNGVSIILNQGDNIEKGDVLQSGADSTLGVTFIDGTVFGLSSNARMVVNEMIYDPNGSNNSSLLSLVAGTISFVAGETAKHGDMKVDTPVATMGIRGTAVLVEIDFSVPGGNGAPSANFQVLVEPDGSTGSYILFDKNTLAPLATVNTAGTLTKISQGIVSFQSGTALSPDVQKLITDVFQQKFTDNNNTNTKTTDHAFTDTPVPQSLAPIKLANGTTAIPIVVNVSEGGKSSSNGPSSQSDSVVHIPGAPYVVTFNNAFSELSGVTGSHTSDTVTGQIKFADVNAGDTPTAKVEFTSFAYLDAHQKDITAALSLHEQAAIAAIEAIGVEQNPGNKNIGSATWTHSFQDGAFDFLGAGETLTLTYTAVVNNNYAPNPEINRTQTFTVTITGTNDVPVITSSIPQTIAFVGGTSVPGGNLTAHVPTSGTLAFDDADLTDTHVVSVKLLLDGLNLPPAPLQILENALTASIATDSTGNGVGQVNWKLADLPVYLADFVPKNETITLTYAVTVTDSQGATDTQDITVTITGTDTPAAVWIATTAAGQPSGGLWSNAANWETGTVPTASDDAIVITDQLIGLTPSYPVTINAPAQAKSLTMNDFGTSPPEVINESTLTIGGALNMSADSILHNSGTISVGGLVEVLDTSVVVNSGGIELQQGGDFKDQSTITNTATGSIEISGGTLNVQVGIANAGLVKIDSGAALTVGIATITGGTVTNAGTLTLNGILPAVPPSTALSVTGTAALTSGTLNNTSVLYAETGAVLDNENVANTGTIEVRALGTLMLDDGTSVANTGGTVKVDSTATLTLNDATISGGTLSNSGTVDIEGSSGATLDGVTVTGSGHIQIDFATNVMPPLILEDGTTITGGTLTVGSVGVLDVKTADGATLDAVGITNNNAIEVFGGSALTLDGGTAVANAGGTIAVDATATLTLNDATISGGTLSNSGTVDIEGASGATLNGVTVTGSGHIQIDVATNVTTTPLILEDGTTITGGTLTVGPVGVLDVKTAGGATLDDVGVTNNNSIEVFGGSTLTLDGGTLVANGEGAITVDATATLTLNDATINDGAIDDQGSIHVTRSSAIDGATVMGGAIRIDSDQTLTLDNTTLNRAPIIAASGSTVQVDDGDTLTLTGVTVTGGTLANDGTVHVTGNSNFESATVNGGLVTIDAGQTVMLYGVTISGSTVTNSGKLTIASDLFGTPNSSGATLDGVTITSTAIEVVAATTLTLDDGTSVTNNGIITVDGTGTLKLNDASISGGIINDYSTVSGSNVAGSIDVTGSSTISNALLNNGQVTVAAHQTLTLDNDTVTGTSFADTASGAVIQIDGGTTLTLSGVTINGGTVNDYSTVTGAIVAGDIDVTGSSTIGNIALNNGNVTLGASQTLTLDSDTVTGTSFIDIADGAVIQIDGDVVLDGVTVTGGTIANTDATLTVDADQTLTLQGGVTVAGGTLENSGTVEIEGASGATFDGVTVTGSGIIQVDIATQATTPLVLTDGTTITGGELKVGLVGVVDIESPDGATLSDVAVTNGHLVEIFAGSALALTAATTVDNTGGIVAIDGTATLTLDDASIDGGTINDYSLVSGSIVAGDIDVTGSSTISNAVLNNGDVTLGTNQTLTLENDTVTGTSFADTADGATIQIEGNSTFDGVAVTGGTIANTDATLTVDADQTLTLQGGVTVAGGTLSNSGTVEIEGASGATFDGVTVTGDGHIQIDAATNVTTPLILEDGTTITGGTLTVGSAGVLDIKTNDGATLDDVAVTNDHLIEVFGGSTLTLDDGTSVDNGEGTITVDGTGAIVLDGASIDGGIINNYSTASGSIVAGDIDVTGSSTISNAQLNNGNVTLGASQTLTLDRDTVTGTSFVDTALGAVIQIDGDVTLDRVTVTGGTVANSDATLTVDADQTLTLQGGVMVTGGTLSNSGTVEIEGASGATLDGVSVTGSGTIQVDIATQATTPLVLTDGTTITGGELNVGLVGVLDIESPDGATLNGVTVTNGHSIEILAGSALALAAATAVDNTGGIVAIDGAATLTLNDASIDGGTIDGYSLVSGSIVAGDIDVTGSSTISNLALNNGQVTLGANQTLTLDTDTVIGTSFDNTADGATIQIEGGVTLNGVTVTGGSIANTDATLTVDADQTLTLQGGVTVAGGTLSNSGTIEIEGASGATLDGVTVTGDGHIQIDAATNVTTPLVLEDGTSITSGTLTVGPVGVLEIKTTDGATLDDVAVTNNHSIEVFGGSTLTLDDGTSVDNGEGTVTVDGAGTLVLDDASIDGGIINNYSTALGTIVAGGIDVTGSSTISSAVLNNGNVTLDANQTLTLDNDTVNGTSFVDTADGATIQIEGNATFDGVAVTGGTIANTDATSTVDVDQTLTLQGGVTVTGGTLDNSGTVEIEGASGATLDGVTVTGSGTIQVDIATQATTPLVLTDGTTITGGELKVGLVGVVDIESPDGATLSDVAVTNGHLVEIFAGSALALTAATTVDNTGGVLAVDGTATLTLNDASIDGGTINDFSMVSGAVVAGDIDVTGSSTISNASLNQGNVSIEDGATLTLDGDTLTGVAFSNVAAGSVIQFDGDDALNGITITGGAMKVASDALVKTSGDVTLTNTTITNDGTIEVIGGTLKISGSIADSSPDGSGSIKIDSHAVLEIDGSDTQNVVFAGTNGELRIDGAGFGGSISGLATTDQIDLRGISFGADTTGGYIEGVLTITDGSHPPISMTLAGDYTNAHFASASDGHGGTLITLNPIDDAPAFAAGDKSESATVTEIANTTGSSALDPLPAASGTLHFTDIDLTDRPTATITQTVSWTNGTSDLSSSLTLGEISAFESAFSLTQSGTTNNGALGWTYQISDGALDFLGANETASVTTTVTLDDHQGGTDTAVVTINIHGANDVPTVSATGGGLAELAGVTGSAATDTATGTISFADADVDDRPVVIASIASSNPFDYKDASGNDLTATLTTVQLTAIAALESGLALAPSSANANTGTVGWTYSVADSALDFMAAGDTLILNYTATVNDQHGGVATAPIAVTITGSDDAPSISGTAVATVTDGGIVNASGNLVATDSDRGDAVAWSVVGGTSVASENYNYGLEDFTVVKGTTTIFHDNFTGTAPPVGPNFLVGTTPTSGVYNVTGGSFVAGPTATLLEGINAAPAGISLGANANYGDVVYGQFLTLLTGTSYNGAGPTQGLRSGQTFTASALFDLNDPADSTTHYGIRLTDRVVGSAAGAFDQPGTETVDLFVVHASNGGMNVVLDETNFEAGTATVLQTIHIPTASAGITDNEILLNLSNSSTSNGHVTASFQMMGINGDGNEVADGGPVSFTTTGQIFDDANWTRAVVYGLSVATSDTAPADVTANAVSALQGTYGTLDVNQNGTWKYFLNPGLASVKALAAGQTAHDIFTIAATDGSGVQTTKPVDITVTGINDAPVADTHGAALGYIENQAPTAIAAGLTLSDVDSATLGSAAVQISGNFVAGEDVLSFTDQHGIHGSYDATAGVLTLTGTSSVANYQAALASVTYFDSSDNPSGTPRTVSFSVDDGATANSHSNVATAVVSVTPIDDAPVLNSMTLTITEGGTTVLTNDDFSVTDPDSSSFLYTVDNVSGGQFEVFNGENWVGAPTGGFTTAQIATGNVEFVQDGTSTAPDFSIFVSDGTDVSAPISPTVNFTPNTEGPTATGFSVSVEGHWPSFASTLIQNDSAPDGDGFTVSGAMLDGTAATFNSDDHAYEVQGSYGQLYIYPQAVSGVDVGGFTDASFKPGDYVFVLDSDPSNPIHTLAPGATLTDTFTYTITDSVTGLESAPATVTLNFADSDIFTGASGGSWTYGGNWMFGVPAAGDIAYIGSGTQVDGSGVVVDGVAVDITDITSAIVVGIANAATLTLQGGTTITGGTITINDGSTLDIEYGTGVFGADATLDQVAVTNSGTVQVGTDSDDTATLTLEDGTTITGGTLAINSYSTLAIAYGEGDVGATLDGVSVSNSGTIRVGTYDDDPTLTLEDGTTITGGTLSIGNESALEIDAGPNGGATLHDVTVYIADSSSTIAVSGGATLTLNDVSIYDGVINDYGTASGDVVPGDIDVTGSSSISYASLNNGNVTVEADQTLTLDGVSVTGTSFDVTASGAIIQVDGYETLTLSDASINGGAIDAYSTASGSIIAGDIDVAGSSAIGNASLNQAYVTVDSGQTLTLSEVTITGGTIDDYGIIDVTGSSTIGDASLNHGNITIEDGQTLTLDNVTVTGTTISFAGSGTLKLGQPTLFSGSISGISGSGDVLDLGGFDTVHDHIVASTGEGSYNSTSNTTMLLVTNETTDQSVTFTLDGDYSNSSWTVTDDQHGGANVVDPPAAKAAAAATVASDTSVEISSPAASAENVIFQTSTGSLTLDHPSSFTGVISGFTGDGTLTGSDQIDLKGIDYHSSAFTESFDAVDDTLHVSDGTHSALVHFSGVYQAANFNFTTDNDGGTIVYDPPVANGASTAANSAPVTATGHGFVFNFAQNGQDAASHPTGDTHLFDGQTFVNAETSSNKLHDDDHANLMPAPDGTEMPSVAAIKAQMHAHDFHFA